MSEKNNLQETGQHVEALRRRRFVRGVGLAVPVAMTVSAKSAMACTCTSVSANSSIKLANSHNATGDVNSTVDCSGKLPSTWKNMSTFNGKTTLFSAIFSPVPMDLQDKNMKQMAGRGDSDTYAVFAAAYLNVLNGYVSNRYYTIGHLQAMWPVAKNGGVES